MWKCMRRFMCNTSGNLYLGLGLWSRRFGTGEVVAYSGFLSHEGDFTGFLALEGDFTGSLSLEGNE